MSLFGSPLLIKIISKPMHQLHDINIQFMKKLLTKNIKNLQQWLWDIP